MDKLKTYWPLIALLGISVLFGLAMSGGRPVLFMHASMGFALIIFATLKIFTPSKFADGFAMYDLLAKHFRPYAYVYPYIELALGFAWLLVFRPVETAWATIAVFGFGAVGVLLAIKNKLNVNCACMGNVLQVPLSTVTLWEDMLMIGMSIALLQS